MSLSGAHPSNTRALSGVIVVSYSPPPPRPAQILVLPTGTAASDGTATLVADAVSFLSSAPLALSVLASTLLPSDLPLWTAVPLPAAPSVTAALLHHNVSWPADVAGLPAAAAAVTTAAVTATATLDGIIRNATAGTTEDWTAALASPLLDSLTRVAGVRGALADVAATAVAFASNITTVALSSGRVVKAVCAPATSSVLKDVASLQRDLDPRALLALNVTSTQLAGAMEQLVANAADAADVISAGSVQTMTSLLVAYSDAFDAAFGALADVGGGDDVLGAAAAVQTTLHLADVDTLVGVLMRSAMEAPSFASAVFDFALQVARVIQAIEAQTGTGDQVCCCGGGGGGSGAPCWGIHRSEDVLVRVSGAWDSFCARRGMEAGELRVDSFFCPHLLCTRLRARSRLLKTGCSRRSTPLIYGPLTTRRCTKSSTSWYVCVCACVCLHVCVCQAGVPRSSIGSVPCESNCFFAFSTTPFAMPLFCTAAVEGVGSVP